MTVGDPWPGPFCPWCPKSSEKWFGSTGGKCAQRLAAEGGKRGAPGSRTASSAVNSSGVLGRSVLSCRRNAEDRAKSRRRRLSCPELRPPWKLHPSEQADGHRRPAEALERCPHPASAAHPPVAHSPHLRSGKCPAVGTTFKYHILLFSTLNISVAPPTDVPLLRGCLLPVGSLGFPWKWELLRRGENILG